MLVLDKVFLTASARPVLQPGEVERLILDKALLQFQAKGTAGGVAATDRLEGGILILTTHRVIWMSRDAQPVAGGLPLAAVADLEFKASNVISHRKIRLTVRTDGQGRPLAGPEAAPPWGHPAEPTLQLVKLHGVGDLQRFLELTQAALTKQAWRANPPAASSVPSHPVMDASPAPSGELPGGSWMGQGPAEGGGPLGAGAASWGPSAASRAGPEPPPHLLQQLMGMGYGGNRATRALQATGMAGVEEAILWLLEHEDSPHLDDPLPGAAGRAPPAAPRTGPRAGVGVAGILRREEQIAAAADRNMDEAFRDLHGLMTLAQEMVTLAERFRASLAEKGRQAGGNEGEEAGEAAMAAELASLGIASPVTKDVAGAQFHQQLSRQLADFLRPRLERTGGLLPLPDVYCLFNRARGTELVSPDDLLQAVKFFPDLHAGLALRTFSSGVLVIQSSSHSDHQVCERVRSMVKGEDGLGPALSASDVAQALHVPLAIAQEHLLLAENAGVLCRDDGPEGLRFFNNFFLEVASC
ncbi:hypothetical protein WJX84_011841 [Apatococcus fuscideae]|uniref:Vacuolar protein-sorting-associated protein 36 n=1 Tax=Apatococcus fuscideae TaxID=2026836 RepID=A0AAW1TFN0_9CHLO